MEAQNDVVDIGRHRAWIEEPYALMVNVDGDITGDHMRQMRDMTDFIGAGSGPVFIVQDLTKAGAFTAAARKEIIDDERTKRVKTVICIGASFQMRVFMTMITKALKLVNPVMPTTLFANDEAEARTILATERKRFERES